MIWLSLVGYLYINFVSVTSTSVFSDATETVVIRLQGSHVGWQNKNHFSAKFVLSKEKHFCSVLFIFIPYFILFTVTKDKLNKLACSQCMGLHSWLGRACRGHGFESRWSPEICFFRVNLKLLKLPLPLWRSHLLFLSPNMAAVTSGASKPAI